MLARFLRKKPIQTTYSSGLHRVLSALDLTLMGIGAIIGAGVFVLTGIAAATKAGPAITVSYLIAGLASLFAALAYAELASSIGGTGSAYQYAYVGFGEFFAWMIGWDLILEYIMSIGTVAIGWSGYVNNFFQALNHPLPDAVAKNPFEGGVINLLAVLIILLLSMLLAIGIKQSARFNAVIVLVKLATILLFIVIASMHVNVGNWHPFLPFGWTGVVEGASLVFFAYIGFDALSTAVEEAIDPERSVPIGIISSVAICTLIYIIVAALLTGIVPYITLNVRSPVADALLNIGYQSAAAWIAVGAIAGLTTVMLVMFYGLSRICLAMCLDGLLPKPLAKIKPQTHTPVRIIFINGLIIAAVAGMAPIDRAAELVNIGTLAAFTFVCAGSIVFRHTHPDLNRPFRLPLYPFIPLLGMFFCLYLMFHLPWVTWWRFLGWLVVGTIIYLAYGQKNSFLSRQ